MAVPPINYLKTSLLRMKIWLLLKIHKFTEVVCILGDVFVIPVSKRLSAKFCL